MPRPRAREGDRLLQQAEPGSLPSPLTSLPGCVTARQKKGDTPNLYEPQSSREIPEFIAFFVCYCTTKFISETVLCEKLTVYSLNMGSFTKMYGQLHIFSDMLSDLEAPVLGDSWQWPGLLAYRRPVILTATAVSWGACVSLFVCVCVCVCVCVLSSTNQRAAHRNIHEQTI